MKLYVYVLDFETFVNIMVDNIDFRVTTSARRLNSKTECPISKIFSSSSKFNVRLYSE